VKWLSQPCGMCSHYLPLLTPLWQSTGNNHAHVLHAVWQYWPDCSRSLVAFAARVPAHARLTPCRMEAGQHVSAAGAGLGWDRASGSSCSSKGEAWCTRTCCMCVYMYIYIYIWAKLAMQTANQHTVMNSSWPCWGGAMP